MARRLGSMTAAALLAVSTLVVLAGPATAAQPGAYRITITNLTDGQPLTPPLLTTHRRPADLFSVGDAANVAVQEIAENGNLAPAIALLDGNKHVADWAMGGAPVVPSGRTDATGFPDQMTFTLDGGPGVKYLSWVSMLICTNDGFSGLDAVRLPDRIGETFTFFANGYDAGTEVNTEDFADIVPPCQGLIGVMSGDTGTGASNPALAENGVIHHHPGIVGDDDLVTDVHGWDDPVARVTVTAL